MIADGEQLGVFLVDAGFVTRSQLRAAQEVAARSGESLAAAIVSQGMLDEDELRRGMAAAFGVPFVTLAREDVSTEALQHIPEPFSRTHNIVAFRQTGDSLEIALFDLADLEKIEQLQHKLRFRILPRLTNRASMRTALVEYQKHLKKRFGDAIVEEANVLAERLQKFARSDETDTSTSDAAEDITLTLADQQAAARLTDLLVQHALTSQASHVHIDPTERGALVRYRIGGMLHEAMQIPLHAGKALVARLRQLAGLSAAVGDTTQEVSQEGRFKVSLNAASEDEYAVRVYGAHATEHGRVTLHIVPTRSGRRGFTPESLGLHGQELEELHRLARVSSGLVLVCGPADSGRTTLLYTLLDMLGGVSRTVGTVENTIEHRVPLAQQSQAGSGQGISTAARLRTLLLQDTDVIMLANIADRETAALAVSAANRGVLVLAGVSGNSAAAGIDTLRRFGVSPNILASSLQLVIATRLVRRLCSRHETHRLSRLEADTLEEKAEFSRVLAALKEEGFADSNAQWKDVTFSRPEPCGECRGGYQGRLGVQEVAPVSRVLRDAIIRGGDLADIERLLAEEGVLNLVEDGLYKAARGQTSVEEILKVA